LSKPSTVGGRYTFGIVIWEGGVAAGDFWGLTAKRSFAANRAAKPQGLWVFDGSGFGGFHKNFCPRKNANDRERGFAHEIREID
jgi:hypothetical protein